MNIFKNIFGARAEQQAEIVTAIADQTTNPKPKYAPEIEQIHHEFETAGERILEQAQTVLKEAENAPVEKVKRLTLLGFKQAKQIEETVQVIKKVELNKELAEMVNQYKRDYPLHKFITETQVKEICYKYNLVCGEVAKYKGFVPEKNLKEIEAFTSKYKFDSWLAVVSNINTSKYKTGDEIMIDMSGFTIKKDNGYYHFFKGGKLSFQSQDGIDFYGRQRHNDLGFGNTFFSRITKNGLQICAPVKDMDMTGMTLDDGYKMKKIHVPDPVVLQPVKYGYLILTAWGEEASDPLVVNETMN